MSGISVVIPLYNKAATIEAAIASVRAQTFADWELVVVDDGSTDAGPQVVEALARQDARVRCIRQPNGGVAAARNAGLQAARSEWVALLDADDHWRPEHLARLDQLRSRFPDVVLCGGACSYIGAGGQVHDPALAPSRVQAPDGLSVIEDYFQEAHDHHLPFNSSSVMLRRDVALGLGGFVRGVTAGEDLLMWARMACAGPVALSAQRTACYMEPPVQAGLSQAAIRRPQTPDVVGAALAELVRSHPQRRSLRLHLADWHRMRAVMLMELGERAASLTEWARAMRWDRPTRKDFAGLVFLILPAGVRDALLARWRAAKRQR